LLPFSLGVVYRARKCRVNARNGILLHPGDHVAVSSSRTPILSSS